MNLAWSIVLADSNFKRDFYFNIMKKLLIIMMEEISNTAHTLSEQQQHDVSDAPDKND